MKIKNLLNKKILQWLLLCAMLTGGGTSAWADAKYGPAGIYLNVNGTQKWYNIYWDSSCSYEGCKGWEFNKNPETLNHQELGDVTELKISGLGIIGYVSNNDWVACEARCRVDNSDVENDNIKYNVGGYDGSGATDDWACGAQSPDEQKNIVIGSNATDVDLLNGLKVGEHTLYVKPYLEKRNNSGGWDWKIDCGKCSATFTIPGYKETSGSKSFGEIMVGENSEVTISTTHYGSITTATANITGDNASEFSTPEVSATSVKVKFTPNSGGNKSAIVTITDAYSKTYTLTVTGTGAQGCTPPEITAQPSTESKNYTQGEAATALSVTATGTNCTYQWKQSESKDGSYINVTAGTGANTETYTPSTANIGTLYYKCEVTACGETVTSDASGAITVIGIYYLRGDLNGWNSGDARKLTLDPSDGYYKSDFYNINKDDKKRFKITNNNGDCWTTDECAWFKWEEHPSKGPKACETPSHDDGIRVKATINGRVRIWFKESTKECAYYFEPKYIVAGEPATIFGKEWKYDREDNRLDWDGEYYSKTFPGASSGTEIKLKVTKNNSWDDIKGGDAYSDDSPTKLNGLGTKEPTDSDGNLIIKLTSDITSFTVKFDETNVFIILSGSCTPTGYAIGGFINGENVAYSDGIKMKKYQYPGYDEMWSAVTSFTTNHSGAQWIWLYDDCGSVKTSGSSSDKTVVKDDENGVTVTPGDVSQGKIKAETYTGAIYNFIYNPTTNKFYFYKIKAVGEITGGWDTYDELETATYKSELVRHIKYTGKTIDKIKFKLSNGHGYNKHTGSGGHDWGFECYNGEKSTLCDGVSVTGDSETGDIVINNPNGMSLDIDIYFNEQEQIYLNLSSIYPAKIEEQYYENLAGALEAVQDGETIDLLMNVEENLTVPSDKSIGFNGNGFSVGNVTVKEGSAITLEGDLVISGDLIVKSGVSTTGQFNNNGNEVTVNGNAYFDKQFEPSSKRIWYTLSLPFDVKVTDMYNAATNEHENLAFDDEVAITAYNSSIRATGETGWQYLESPSDILKAGTLYNYIINHFTQNNNIRFKAADKTKLFAANTIPLTYYTGSSSDVTDFGWNGIGNNQLYSVKMSCEGIAYGLVYQSNSYSYSPYLLNESVFNPGTAVFLQCSDAEPTVTLSAAQLKSADIVVEPFKLNISGNGTDYCYISASLESKDAYDVGKDLIKMGTYKSGSYVSMWIGAYGLDLSCADLKVNGNEAYAGLGIYAPDAGNYKLYADKLVNGQKLILVKDGVDLFDFADGEYSIALAKGINSGYGIKIVTDNTPTETKTIGDIVISAKDGKISIKGLNGGEEYVVNNMFFNVASGVADGSEVTIDVQKGTYIVKIGESKVKIVVD